jgi:hypothetical protein
MTQDWRLQGQERFLQGATLCRRKYTQFRDNWEHDHCEFCDRKFSERQGDVTEGYSTMDGYHWICGNCFADFEAGFDWKIAKATDEATGKGDGK